LWKGIEVYIFAQNTVPHPINIVNIILTAPSPPQTTPVSGDLLRITITLPKGWAIIFFDWGRGWAIF